MAPAVQAATGFSVKPCDPAEDIDADHFSPFEYQLRSSIENLEALGVVCPDFDYAGKGASVVYAQEASELLFKKTSEQIWTLFSKLCQQMIGI